MFFPIDDSISVRCNAQSTMEQHADNILKLQCTLGVHTTLRCNASVVEKYANASGVPTPLGFVLQQFHCNWFVGREMFGVKRSADSK